MSFADCLSVMDDSSLKSLSLSWRSLAVIDGEIVEKCLNSDGVKAHKIDVAAEYRHPENGSDAVQRFLEREYQKSFQVVKFQSVSYLPSDSFSQIGLFASSDIKSTSFIPGVSGFLSLLPDEEHLVNVNDFSLIATSRKIGETYLMLGPISFLN